MKIISLLFILITISAHSFSQDRLVLNNDSVIVGRITAADSSRVEIRKSIRPNGPDYIFRRKEIKKVVLENGQTVFYPHSYTELSLGISTSLVYYKDEYLKSQGIHDFNYKSIGISFIVRDRVLSLRLESGYARLYKTTIYVQDYHYYGYSYYTYDTLNTDVYFGFMSLRTNFSRGKFNPYLFISIGIDQYRVNGDVIVIENTRLGTGLQYKIENKYIVEGELGFNIWNEQIGSPDENNGTQIYPFFGLNVYRIINTYYR